MPSDSTSDNVSKLIDDLVDDPDALENHGERLDQMLLDIVKLEKKHLHGLEQTSDRRRREELLKYLTSHLK